MFNIYKKIEEIYRLKNTIDYGNIELPYHVWSFLKQQADLYKE